MSYLYYSIIEKSTNNAYHEKHDYVIKNLCMYISFFKTETYFFKKCIALNMS